jgi:hypothetical protein
MTLRLCYTLIMIKAALILAFLVTRYNIADAQYVLELKNGRQITVQNYREEGPMLKFQGFGGEIGITKDQIRTVRKSGVGEFTGFNISEATPSREPEGRRLPENVAPQSTGPENPINEDEKRNNEEIEYRKRVAETTQELKEARTRYATAVRGNSGRDPMQLSTEEQIQARNADITSRFKDAQNTPSEPASVKVLRPSPFTSLPATVEYDIAGQATPNLGRPEPYTELERQLSDLRRRVVQLEKEREQLIREMQEKNFDTGALFLD